MSETKICVRGYHIDAYGHVNNARYLEFLEEARWSFFEYHHLISYLQDMMMIVTRIDIRYRHPAQRGDWLNIKTSVESIFSRRLILSQHITLANSGKTVAQAEVTIIPVSTQTGRIVAFNPKLLQLAHLK